ncbi:MAG TPA: polyphosphate kinase 2 family protein [Silvibacterium sp.]|nr:polyphosphate kinase 2 family protein [Silvibacterium sp.]
MAKESRKSSPTSESEPDLWSASARNDVIRKAAALAKQCRVNHGATFRLKDHDPADTMGFKSEDHPRAKQALASGVRTLFDMQDMLYAQDKWAVLLIFQGIDAGGKDGAIKHVMSGVNPAGCQVYSFKQPSSEDLDHDYLWRCVKCLPNRGHIGIFNRSYYEEVLVVRVHRQLLANEKIPPSLVTKNIWKERYEDIREFERHLHRNGIVTAKFFLNLSKEEQKRRFLDRTDDPDKNWKFSSADVAERAYWDAYQEAFEDMIRNTSTQENPWYVIPADHKWLARIVVAAAVVHTLGRLDLSYPRVDKAKLAEIKKAKEALLSEP